MADDDAPPGVPEWVVTYGDMMSLLLTFFIMLVSLSEVKANKKYRAVLESLQQTVGYRSGPITPPGDEFPLNSLVERLSSLGSFSDDEAGRGGVKGPQQVPGQDLRVRMPRHGRAVRAGELVLFEQFSTDLTEEGRQRVRKIAEVLAGKPNKVEVRGHTGATPLPQTPAEAELVRLSFQRARMVADQLLAAGIESPRIRLVALGAHEPLPKSNDAEALRDDRVEVMVLDTDAGDYVGASATPR